MDVQATFLGCHTHSIVRGNDPQPDFCAIRMATRGGKIPKSTDTGRVWRKQTTIHQRRPISKSEHRPHATTSWSRRPNLISCVPVLPRCVIHVASQESLQFSQPVYFELLSLISYAFFASHFLPVWTRGVHSDFSPGMPSMMGRPQTPGHRWPKWPISADIVHYSLL